MNEHTTSYVDTHFVIADDAWMTQRACVDVPTEVFFPENVRDAATAKAICAACPVSAECLAYATENREEHGVWGGLAPWERGDRRTRRPAVRPPVARCGTDGGYYRHLRYTFSEPCQACKEAHAMAWRLRKHREAVVR